MTILKRWLGKFRSRRTKRLSEMAGAVYGAQSLVGVRKENGVFLAIRSGIDKTVRESGAPKSAKLLRREKDAMWLRDVLQKRYDELCAKEAS